MNDNLKEVKAALSTYVITSAHVDRLIDRRMELSSKAVYTGPQFDKTGVKQGSTPDKFAETIATIDIIDQKLNKAVTAMNKQYEQVEGLIESLGYDYTARIVLEYRYINGCEWVDIANKLNMSLSHLYRIHARGLMAIKEKCFSRSNRATPD